MIRLVGGAFQLERDLHAPLLVSSFLCAWIGDLRIALPIVSLYLFSTASLLVPRLRWLTMMDSNVHTLTFMVVIYTFTKPSISSYDSVWTCFRVSERLVGRSTIYATVLAQSTKKNSVKSVCWHHTDNFWDGIDWQNSNCVVLSDNVSSFYTAWFSRPHITWRSSVANRPFLTSRLMNIRLFPFLRMHVGPLPWTWRDLQGFHGLGVIQHLLHQGILVAALVWSHILPNVLQ